MDAYWLRQAKAARRSDFRERQINRGRQDYNRNEMVKTVAGGKQGVEYKLTNWIMSDDSRSASSRRLQSDDESAKTKTKKADAGSRHSRAKKPVKQKAANKPIAARYPKRRPCKVVDF